MTEVPEHLLQRSRARRAALGLGGEAGDVPVPAAQPAAAAAPSSAPAPAAAAPAPEITTPKPPERRPPYVEAALTRKKIPYWVIPVLLMLPFWGIVYALTLDKPSPTVAGPLTQGQTEFTTCGACHGSTGGGGVGPKLAGGAVLSQFPKIQDHLYWVMEGSAGFQQLGIKTFGAHNSPVEPGMPSWADALTPTQLIGVVRYERETLSGQKVTPAILTQEYNAILAMIKQKYPDKLADFQAAVASFKGLDPSS